MALPTDLSSLPMLQAACESPAMTVSVAIRYSKYVYFYAQPSSSKHFYTIRHFIHGNGKNEGFLEVLIAETRADRHFP
jgi:hypothetical protein